MAPWISLLLCTTALLLATSDAQVDLTEISKSCSEFKFDPAISSFGTNSIALHAKLITDINVNVGRWHDASDTNDDANTAFGVASCTGGIDFPSCKQCLEFIVNDYMENGMCESNVLGMEVTLGNCSMTVENFFIE
ncbi:hypothetical protein Mapa_015602 [Marchantia paleacea]|nr:hypothetical protein Mapa_015602 [Marchantia paleacea]